MKNLFGYTRILAIGDIHGMYEKLIKLMDKIRYNSEEDLLIFLGDYTPAGTQSRIVKGIGFLLVGLLLSGLYLYCLWIIFCYMIHLKYDRVDLVCGDFKKIKNINTMSLAGMKINENNYKLI